MRTSVRISCTTQATNRAGGVSSIVLPQNIDVPEVYPYGTLQSSTNSTIGYFGAMDSAGIAKFSALLNGSGATFTSAESLANNAMQWDLTPASFIGFHTYEDWFQQTTADGSPQTVKSYDLNSATAANPMRNLMTYADLLKYCTQSDLNVCNALFVFRGQDLSAQSYQVEISHMIAARFSANTLLATGAVSPAPDPSGVVQQAAAAVQATGSAPIIVGPGSAIPRQGPTGRNGGRLSPSAY